MEKKITKAMVLTAIAAAVEEMDVVATVDGVDVTGEDVVAYCKTTLDQLAARADKAKERAAQKRAESDELRALVASVLTEEFQTADAITAQVDVEDITKAKVVSRLSALIKDGQAHKAQIKDGDRKVMAYAVGPEPTADAE